MSSKKFLMTLILVVLLPLVGCQAKDQQQTTETAVGDWLLAHMLSDPEQLNPLTSNDGGASSILGYIFQGLLTRDPHTLEPSPPFRMTS